MHAHLIHTIEHEADIRAKEHNSLLDVLVGPLGGIWSVAKGHIVLTMLKADFGTLDKIKSHQDRSQAVLDAAQTF